VSAFEIDGVQAVAELEDIDWTLPQSHPTGVCSQRALHTLHKAGSWATVLIAIQDRKKFIWQPVRYVFAKYRKLGGLWRLQQHMRINPKVFAEITQHAADFQSEANEKSAPF